MFSSVETLQPIAGQRRSSKSDRRDGQRHRRQLAQGPLRPEEEEEEQEGRGTDGFGLQLQQCRLCQELPRLGLNVIKLFTPVIYECPQ
jgi:hypothetical protein